VGCCFNFLVAHLCVPTAAAADSPGIQRQPTGDIDSGIVAMLQQKVEFVSHRFWGSNWYTLK
jgi:hypothetical protein